MKDYTTRQQRLARDTNTEPTFGKALLWLVGACVLGLIALKILASQYGI